jgi:hypothetical protein
LDHLVMRRDDAVQRLRERPQEELPIVSLYVTMRGLCEQGYDRDYLAQIRAVLNTEPRLAYAQLSIGIRAFEMGLLAALESRLGPQQSSLGERALTLMVLSFRGRRESRLSLRGQPLVGTVLRRGRRHVPGGGLRPAAEPRPQLMGRQAPADRHW